MQNESCDCHFDALATAAPKIKRTKKVSCAKYDGRVCLAVYICGVANSIKLKLSVFYGCFECDLSFLAIYIRRLNIHEVYVRKGTRHIRSHKGVSAFDSIFHSCKCTIFGLYLWRRRERSVFLLFPEKFASKEETTRKRVKEDANGNQKIRSKNNQRNWKP